MSDEEAGRKKQVEDSSHAYTDLDFQSKHQFQIDSIKRKDSDGNDQIFDKEIWCTEFAPDVFAQLRSIDGFS